MKHATFALLAALTLAAPGCKKKSEGKQATAKLADFTDKMCACSTAACADQVNAELQKWSETQPKAQKDSMTDEDKKKSEALAKKLVDCMRKAGGPGNAAAGSAVTPAGSADVGSAAAGSADVGSGSAGSATGESGSATASAAGSAAGSGATTAVDVPPECQTYRATIDRLATCDKMSADQRDAFKNAYDAASKNWTNFSASQKDSIARTCNQANAAVVAAAKTQCGW